MSTETPQRHLGDELVPPPPETGTRFPLLDSLRAVGAVAVLTTHVSYWSGDYTRHGALGTLLGRLDVGVAIFFVLSGFLLSRPYLVSGARGTRRPRTPEYLWKRLVRIAPVYLLTAVVALTFVRANDDLGASDWVTTLLLANTYVDPIFPAGLTHMWSLAVEVSFYLVLPLLMLGAVGRGRLKPWRVAAVLVGCVGVAVWWHLDGAARIGAHSSGAPLQWLPSYLGWFAVGIGLALVHVLEELGRWPAVTSAVRRTGSLPGSCWALAAGLLLVTATPVAGPTMFGVSSEGQALTKNLLYGAIGGLVVLSGIFAAPTGGYARVLGRPFARRLGWISYGVFCLHLPVLHFVMWATGWPLFEGRGLFIWCLTVLLSLLVAEVVYRLVERPALRLKRLGRRPEAETSTPTSGTNAA